MSVRSNWRSACPVLKRLMQLTVVGRAKDLQRAPIGRRDSAETEGAGKGLARGRCWASSNFGGSGSWLGTAAKKYMWGHLDAANS